MTDPSRRIQRYSDVYKRQPAYRALHKSGIPFATGILHENDVDYQLARDLANEVVSAPAF